MQYKACFDAYHMAWEKWGFCFPSLSWRSANRQSLLPSNLPCSHLPCSHLPPTPTSQYLHTVAYMLGSNMSIGRIIGSSLCPVTLGNFIGGSFFVATFYSAVYGQLFDLVHDYLFLPLWRLLVPECVRQPLVRAAEVGAGFWVVEPAPGWGGCTSLLGDTGQAGQGQTGMRASHHALSTSPQQTAWARCDMVTALPSLASGSTVEPGTPLHLPHTGCLCHAVLP